MMDWQRGDPPREKKLLCWIVGPGVVGLEDWVTGAMTSAGQWILSGRRNQSGISVAAWALPARPEGLGPPSCERFLASSSRAEGMAYAVAVRIYGELLGLLGIPDPLWPPPEGTQPGVPLSADLRELVQDDLFQLMLNDTVRWLWPLTGPDVTETVHAVEAHLRAQGFGPASPLLPLPVLTEIDDNAA